MNVYHEILPDRYVLLLSDSTPSAASAAPDSLARCLQQAYHSGKTSVWIDCSRLQSLSAAARDLLLRYRQRLGRRSVRLVLSLASPNIRQAFADVAPEARPEIAEEEPA